MLTEHIGLAMHMLDTFPGESWVAWCLLQELGVLLLQAEPMEHV